MQKSQREMRKASILSAMQRQYGKDMTSLNMFNCVLDQCVDLRMKIEHMELVSDSLVDTMRSIMNELGTPSEPKESPEQEAHSLDSLGIDPVLNGQ